MRCFLPTVRVLGNFPARTYAWTVWTFRWSASATSRVVYRWGRSGMGAACVGVVEPQLFHDGSRLASVRVGGGACCEAGAVLEDHLRRDDHGLAVRVNDGRAVVRGVHVACLLGGVGEHLCSLVGGCCVEIGRAHV